MHSEQWGEKPNPCPVGGHGCPHPPKNGIISIGDSIREKIWHNSLSGLI